MFSYHSHSVIDEGLPEHHVVEIRIHPDLRPHGGIDRNDRDVTHSPRRKWQGQQQGRQPR